VCVRRTITLDKTGQRKVDGDGTDFNNGGLDVGGGSTWQRYGVQDFVTFAVKLVKPQKVNGVVIFAMVR